MQPDPTVLLACLAVAALGVLCLAIGVGRKRRWRDPTRLFSWPQKQQLIRQANGRCEHKPPLWFRCPAPGTEADHIHPWSRGGATELWNGQMLCRRHNRRKSNRVPSPLYRWRLARRRKRYADDSWSRRDSFGRYEREEYEVGMRRASELIDPVEDGGPYPSQLQCSQHNGFGPCPGAPYCTPKDS